MENSTVKVLGQHNGIRLIEKDNGDQFYYSIKTGKCAISVRGLARMLGNAQPKNIANQAVEFITLKDCKVYTQQGVQGVDLILESELPKLLTKIINSKMKKDTKESATKMLESLAQAGFRLMVLLEVAPEIVAKEAINLIADDRALADVQQHANLHGQYLRSEFALNYEAKENDLKAGLIKGKNNLAFGLDWKGGRHNMNDVTKSAMTTTQLYQAKGLNSIRKSDKDFTEEQKYAVCDKVRDVMSKLDALIDSI